jgi:predicted nucleotidyltransferase
MDSATAIRKAIHLGSRSVIHLDLPKDSLMGSQRGFRKRTDLDSGFRSETRWGLMKGFQKVILKATDSDSLTAKLKVMD